MPPKKKKPQGKAHKITERAKLKAKDLENQKSVTPVIIDEHKSELKYLPDVTAGLYNPEILPRVEELAAKGLNNKEIAIALGIGERTFYEWREKHPQFWHSLKKYRGLANIEVENALYKSAVGFNFTERKRERRKTGVDPETGKPIYELLTTEEIDKHIPGIPTSQIFYLKNRMPERYKDKIETQISFAQDISQIAFVIKRREE